MASNTIPQGATAGPLNADTNQQGIPTIDLGTIGGLLPSIPGLSSGDVQTPGPLDPNAPRAASALATKYTTYFPALEAQYSAPVIAAMKHYDQIRVQQGQSPLSEKETIKALQTAQTNQPATPPADKSLLDVPGNAWDDLSNIVTSIPRLPMALYHELASAGDIGKSISEAKNPIEGLAKAPLLRMIPGAFVVGNIAGGTPGELLRHPLFTALDLLPGAEKLAEHTAVATVARDTDLLSKTGQLELTPRAARIVGKQATRPITTFLLNRLDEEGGIERNTAGQLVDKITGSRPGSALRERFGQDARDGMFIVNNAMQRTPAVLTGVIDPVTQVEKLTHAAGTMVAELNKINPDLVPRMNELSTRWSLGNFQGMTPDELRGSEVFRKMNSDIAQWGDKAGVWATYDQELYDAATGQKLIKGDLALKQSAKYNALRNDIVSSQADPVAIAQRMIDELHTTKPGDYNLTRKSLHRQLRNAGYDTSELDQLWTNANRKPGEVNKKGVLKPTNELADYTSALEDIVSGKTVLPHTPLMSADQILETIRTHTPKDDIPTMLGLEKIKTGIKNGEWKVVSEGLNQIKRTDIPELQTPEFLRSVRELRETSRHLGKDLSAYDDARHATRINKFNRLHRDSIPARWMPKAAEIAKAEVLHRVIPMLDATEAAKAIKLAEQGRWLEIPGVTPKMFNKITDEAARTWQTLRDEATARGDEGPIFMHTVTPNKAPQAIHPQATIVPSTPSSVRARMLDMAPGVQDMSIAVSHQMLEFMSQQQAEVAIKQLMEQYGRSEQSLRAEFADTATARLQQNKALDFEGHIQSVMNKGWRKFNPEEAGYNWGSPYLKKLAGDQMWIPKELANNLKKLADPKQVMGGLMDPLTNLFRIATTSLSLRTQLYNIIGGEVALELAQPGATLRSGTKAYEMLRGTAEMPEALKTIVGQRKHLLQDMDREALGIMNEGVYGFLKGKMMKRFWDAEQEAKVPGASLAHRYGGKFKDLVQKSYDLNGMFDDFYRVTSYIDTYDKAVAKGYTGKAAEDLAISTTRKVLQDWMGMTPFERSAVKSVIPFYTYMGHAVRFVMRYPFDHPLRAEIFSKLAEAELEDQGSLPSRFLSQMFFGSPGPMGEQNAINLDPMNPFGGVANFMTISGLLGQTNPLISTALEIAGIDSTGNAQLYPDLRYDPVTGRLVADTGNPLEKLLHNTIPQANLLTSLLGLNTQYKDQLKRDPAGALRFLASNATLPILWKRVDVNTEKFKAELAREKSESTVLNQALKTGDWSEALQYPSLREYLQALDQLPDDQLAQYQAITPDIAKGLQNGTVPNTYTGTTPLNDLVQQQMAIVQGQPQGAAATGQPAPGQFAPGGSLTNQTGGV